jgi:hypothetical protein
MANIPGCSIAGWMGIPHKGIFWWCGDQKVMITGAVRCGSERYFPRFPLFMEPVGAMNFRVSQQSGMNIIQLYYTSYVGVNRIALGFFTWFNNV